MNIIKSLNFNNPKNYFLNINFKDFVSLFLGTFPIFLILGNALLNLYFVLIIIFTILLIVKFNIKNFNFDALDYLILFFFSLFILTTFINQMNVLDMLFSIRFLFLYFFLKILFLHQYINIELTLKFITLTFLFVLFDTILQFFFGYDIFGIKPPDHFHGRLTGPFGDEPIPGSFLISYVFFSIFYINRIINKNFINMILILVTTLTILITGERISFVMSILSIFLLIVLNYNKFRSPYIILILLLFSLIIYFLFITNEYVFERYANLFSLTNSATPAYLHHFLAGLKIIYNNPLFGAGHDSFKIICSSEIYEFFFHLELEKRCSTHVHNIHIQLISSYGIITYLIFCYFIFVFFRKIINKKLFYIVPANYLIIQLLILIFPLKTTGDIFSTWYGSLFWYNLFLLIFILQDDKIFNNN